MTTVDAYIQSQTIQLNDQQKQALSRVDGATLLLAVPGSGKTTVIIYRLGYMIKALGIDSSSILTLTFSRAGARDLGRRYRTLLGGAGEAPRFSTIHSFSLSVIRSYERMYGRKAFDILEDIGGVLRDLYIQCYKSFPSDNDLADITSAITYCKNMMLNTEEIAELKVGDIDFPKIYEAYEEYKRQHHLMDFDDMLKYAWLLLKKDEQLLDRFTKRYHYINIDEAQDTSKIQFELIHLLVSRWGNVFMVGDEDQSIYGFRGAYPQGLLEFKTHYPKGEVLLMETNFRSSRYLVAAADRFITLNEERYKKHMVTANADGVLPAQEHVASLEDQYRFILDSVRMEGKDIAVLYRNNESSIPLVDLFEREGVRYRLKEHNPLFFTHFVVRDIRAFFELAKDMTDLDVFTRIYYKMNCGISKVNMEQMTRRKKPTETVFHALAALPGVPEWLIQRLEDQEACFKRLAGLPMNRAIDYIYNQMGYREHLDYRIERGYREEQLTQKLDILRTLANRAQNVTAFFTRLDELEGILRGSVEPERHGVVLSTIHSSKGLEFEKVFIIDAVDGEFPSATALQDTEDSRRLFNEEVRLFYVGVTRAKRELEFITVGKKGVPNRTRPVSRFVDIYMGRRKPVRVEPKPAKSRLLDIRKMNGQHYKQAKVNDVDEEKYPPGCRLIHRGFGAGELISLSGSVATIRFDNVGVKKLNLSICLANKIIHADKLDTE